MIQKTIIPFRNKEKSLDNSLSLNKCVHFFILDNFDQPCNFANVRINQVALRLLFQIRKYSKMRYLVIEKMKNWTLLASKVLAWGWYILFILTVALWLIETPKPIWQLNWYACVSFVSLDIWDYEQYYPWFQLNE